MRRRWERRTGNVGGRMWWTFLASACLELFRFTKSWRCFNVSEKIFAWTLKWYQSLVPILSCLLVKLSLFPPFKSKATDKMIQNGLICISGFIIIVNGFQEREVGGWMYLATRVLVDMFLHNTITDANHIRRHWCNYHLQFFFFAAIQLFSSCLRKASSSD